MECVYIGLDVINFKKTYFNSYCSYYYDLICPSSALPEFKNLIWLRFRY